MSVKNSRYEKNLSILSKNGQFGVKILDFEFKDVILSQTYRKLSEMPFVSQKQSRQEKMTDFDGSNGRFLMKMVYLSQNGRF